MNRAVEANVAMIRNVAARLGHLRECAVFLSRKFQEYLNNRTFLDALPGHLLPDFASQQRIPVLMKRIMEIADL